MGVEGPREHATVWVTLDSTTATGEGDEESITHQGALLLNRIKNFTGAEAKPD